MSKKITELEKNFNCLSVRLDYKEIYLWFCSKIYPPLSLEYIFQTWDYHGSNKDSCLLFVGLSFEVYINNHFVVVSAHSGSESPFAHLCICSFQSVWFPRSIRFWKCRPLESGIYDQFISQLYRTINGEKISWTNAALSSFCFDFRCQRHSEGQKDWWCYKRSQCDFWETWKTPVEDNTPWRVLEDTAFWQIQAYGETGSVSPDTWHIIELNLTLSI